MDFDLLNTLNGAAARHAGLEHVMRFFAIDGVTLFVVALLALSLPTARFANRAGRRGSALATSAAFLLAAAPKHARASRHAAVAQPA